MAVSLTIWILALANLAIFLTLTLTMRKRLVNRASESQTLLGIYRNCLNRFFEGDFALSGWICFFHMVSTHLLLPLLGMALLLRTDANFLVVVVSVVVSMQIYQRVFPAYESQ